MAHVDTAPPEAIPDQYKESVGKLHNQVLTIFQHRKIPYTIMAQMADDGYVGLEDLADRWTTVERARTDVAADLLFRPQDRGGLFTQAQTDFISMRFSQCVRQAQSMLHQGHVGARPPVAGGEAIAPAQTTSLEALCDRRQLLGQWTQIVQLSHPRLEDQGSDALLKKQFRLCAQGEIGWIHNKHIISALPEPDERPIKTNRRVSVDGWEKEEEEETRKPPSTRRQLEHMHLVFRNNLLMAMLAFPSMPKLNATYQDLEEWYRWFWGKDIADRRPPPSENTLLWAERNAWREIHNLVYGGKTLKEAMDLVRRDTLFWTREVYESVQRQKGNKGQPTTPTRPAKAQGRAPSWSPKQTQWKPKGAKGKSKSPMGAGKGKDNEWPATWAKTSPRGLPFCRDFHLKKKCPGNCGRSHNCPVMKNGWICNAAAQEHTPDQCPHK